MTIKIKKSASFPGEAAGFVTRLIAFVVDAAIITGIFIVASALGAIVLRFFNFDFILRAVGINDAVWINILRLIYYGSLLIIYLGLFFFYHPFFWWLAGGRTPGKYLMGIQVVSQNGQNLRLLQCSKRYLGYWFSAWALFLGYLWVLIDDDRRSWHDKFARTRVIYTWDSRQSKARMGIRR